MGHGLHNGFRPAAHLQLVKNVSDVILDCVFTDKEFPSNFFVIQAFSQGSQNLSLSRGEMTSLKLCLFSPELSVLVVR